MKTIHFIIFYSLFYSTTSISNSKTFKGNEKISNFQTAKKILEEKIYSMSSWKRSFYCNCPYTDHNSIDLKSCGFISRSNNSRSKRIEWEHIVPAHAFGQSFKEWRDGSSVCVSKSESFKGRKCAAKVNLLFRKMESDLYNLVPVIGEVNADRNNFSFGLNLDNKAIGYGKCKKKISNRKAVPPEDKRGFIARVYFYMHEVYPGHGIISKKNRKLFEAWDKEFPVTKLECERGQKIEMIQGNLNQILKTRCESLY